MSDVEPFDTVLTTAQDESDRLLRDWHLALEVADHKYDAWHAASEAADLLHRVQHASCQSTGWARRRSRSDYYEARWTAAARYMALTTFRHAIEDIKACAAGLALQHVQSSGTMPIEDDLIDAWREAVEDVLPEASQFLFEDDSAIQYHVWIEDLNSKQLQDADELRSEALDELYSKLLQPYKQKQDAMHDDDCSSVG